jgi:outer membrane protein insertion porin family
MSDALCEDQLPDSAVHPLNKQYTIALNGELGWGKGLGGNPIHLQELLLGRPGLGARLRARLAGPRDSVNTNLALGGTRS